MLLAETLECAECLLREDLVALEQLAVKLRVQRCPLVLR